MKAHNTVTFRNPSLLDNLQKELEEQIEAARVADVRLSDLKMRLQHLMDVRTKDTREAIRATKEAAEMVEVFREAYVSVTLCNAGVVEALSRFSRALDMAYGGSGDG
jgi:hypothetical protein